MILRPIDELSMDVPIRKVKSRLHDLDKILNQYASLWRPQPFKEARLEWCAEYPELTAALLKLSDDDVERLERDHQALLSLITLFIPQLNVLDELCTLPQLNLATETLNEAKFGWEIPGRKLQQIQYFSQAVSSDDTPVLEWCGGKGHLGRTLGKLWQQPVDTVEWNQALCDEGRRLSEREGVNQVFHAEDAMDEKTALRARDKQVVALHACGDLHRQLIRVAQPEAVNAMDIAPCCYHLGRLNHYIPFNNDLSLRLSRDDLRLAVTNSDTASRAQLALRNKEMAWKLGYDVLRHQLQPDIPYRNIKSINKQWLKFSFESFCEQLAMRDELPIPEGLDWPTLEQQGWQRQHDVMRLNLLRFAFRRAIEVWLVLDMVTFLQARGYIVYVTEFCEKHITPRNILISARYPRSARGNL